MPKRASGWIAVVVSVFLAGLLLGTHPRAGGEGLRPAAAVRVQDVASAVANPGSARPVDTHMFRNIAEQQNPAVVFITTQTRTTSSGPQALGDEFFRQFFGQPPTGPREQIQQAEGSGFIINDTGEILTNNHVIAGADEIRVGLFADAGKRYQAHVVGRDPLTDTALIRLDDPPDHLAVASLGDSDALRPGDWVMAIGNPFDLGHTVTVGVVSFLGRPFLVSEGRYQKMIQTDASINPGNSGGPLIDTDGLVVGINAAILDSATGGNIGIGFAVPINTAKALLPDLRTGAITRGRIGLRVTDVSADEAQALHLPAPEGALVRQVEVDSPAQRAGVEAGDVVVEYQGNPVRNADDLVALVTQTKPGTEATLVLVRNGTRQTLTVAVEALQAGEDSGAASQSSTTGFGLTLGTLAPDMAGRLGLPPGTQGALIEDVQPGSAAQAAGLQPNDVLLEVDRRAVRSATEAAAALRQARSAPVVFLLISRGGSQLFVSMRTQ